MSFPDPRHDHNRCTSELLSRAEQTCARQGSRLTSQRREILACVAQGHAAVGAYEIIERMAEKGPRPAPITVYRGLDFLLSHGLVHKIESRNAYVACSHSHQDQPAALMICDHCGTVSEFDAGEAMSSISKAAEAQGFLAARTVIELAGTCTACQGAA